MKIGIISFFLNGNSGSNLQALALQRVVRKMGCEVEHIRITRNKTQKLTQCLKDFLEIIKHPSYLEWILPILKRQRTPIEFPKLQPKEFGFKYTKKNVSQLTDKEYDAYIVGSDQIWSPLKFPFDEEVFLPKVSRERKMAYAASFGVDKMPRYNAGRIKRLLKGFQYLSFRETSVIKTSNIKYIEQYEEVLDPTLLLDYEEWDSLIKDYVQSTEYFGKYALCYFLDEPTVQQVSIIHSLCKKQSLNKVVCIGKGGELFKNEGMEIEVLNVENLEFVKMIRESSIIFTDSFHGTIFSVLYNKYLAIFHRNNGKIAQQFNRIQGLASKLHFETLIVEENGRWEKNNIFEFDYSKTNNCISEQRENSTKYLYNTINAMKGK